MKNSIIQVSYTSGDLKMMEYLLNEFGEYKPKKTLASWWYFNKDNLFLILGVLTHSLLVALLFHHLFHI